jgi:Fe-S-cluster containining protein
MIKESIFLTCERAVEAVCFDFRQYDPQIRVFCRVLRLISGGNIVAKRDREKNGAWISAPGLLNMRWMDGPEMVEYLCEALTTADLNPELLSSICARVFHERAYPEVDPETGGEGIRIETGMEDFVCRQCGQCCRSLDYHREVTAEDVVHWRESGRTDILEWVGVYEQEGKETAYRIWTIPGTAQPAENCPFLEAISPENRWVCRIHDAKPGICRQYPSSRKHAVMTGCPGFEGKGRGG